MTLVLTRSDVRALLDMDACIDAVEAAFVAHAEGRAIVPAAVGAHVEGGGFHVKTAGLLGEPAYFVTKTNGNFPDNPAARGLPTVQGVISLHDARDGRVLALLDAMEITALRTAAATAVAARHLARRDAGRLLVVGCGVQGRVHVAALSRVRRLTQVAAWDSRPEAAVQFARDMARSVGVAVIATDDHRAAAREADIVVTCTPSREPLLGADDVGRGAFVAGVGADSEDKHELSPGLMAASRVVADVLAQCEAFGDLHHALAAGTMRRSDVHAELADVVSGRRPGREDDDAIFVFDSTGTAIEDVAAAVVVYERARAAGRGLEVALGD